MSRIIDACAPDSRRLIFVFAPNPLRLSFAYLPRIIFRLRVELSQIYFVFAPNSRQLPLRVCPEFTFSSFVLCRIELSSVFVPRIVGVAVPLLAFLLCFLAPITQSDVLHPHGGGKQHRHRFRSDLGSDGVCGDVRGQLFRALLPHRLLLQQGERRQKKRRQAGRQAGAETTS